VPTLDGLHATIMRPRVEALLADDRMRAVGLTLVSGYRSPDYQAKLFAAAVKKYGSERAASKWVARPWYSNHGPRLDDAGRQVPAGPGHGGKWGSAVDLGVRGVAAVKGQWPARIEQLVNAVAAEHGLFSPMDWEDWHFQPIPGWQPPKQQRIPKGLPAITVPMTEGQRSDGIAFMQYLLHDLSGAPAAADGVYGPKTTAAVKAFQKFVGHLTVNGIVDAATWSTILTAYGQKHR
jgi:hypothetical protein